MNRAHRTVAMLALIAALPMLAVLAGHAEGFSLEPDRGEYHVGERVHVVASGTAEPVTFQVVWGGTTLVVRAVPAANGSCTLEFTLPADVVGTVEVHAASPRDNRTTSFVVVPRDVDGGGDGGLALPDLPMLPLLVGTVAVTVGALGGMWSVEATRWYLLGIPAVLAGAYYQRKEPSMRQEIRNCVYKNPWGIPLPIIQTTLGIAQGTAVYHLRKLIKQSEVYSIRKGTRRLFYPANVSWDGATVMLDWTPSRTQEAILEHLTKVPGSTQKQLSAALDMTVANVSYNLQVLKANGRITESDAMRPMTYDVVRQPKDYKCASCGYSFSSTFPPRVCAYCGLPIVDDSS